MPPASDLDLRTYAAVSVALAGAPGSRDQVLSAHGLDEEAWDAIDDAWQGRLSSAIDEQSGEAVPPLVVEYETALREAQAGAEMPMSLERFAELTSKIQRGGDLAAVLAQTGVPFAVYLRASAHWTPRLASDPALAEQFTRLTRLR